jgi:outer membrane protein insertion porin family
MIRSVKNRFLLLIISISAMACSGTRHLPAGEKLYIGSDIKLITADHIKKREKQLIISNAKNTIHPFPNKSFLGIRPKLWAYMSAGESPKGRFRKWLKKRGEAPVLMNEVKPAVSSAIIDAKLFNIGIFKSSTQFIISEKKYTSKVRYVITIHKPYTVKEITYSIYDDRITKLIQTESGKSLIVPGDIYNLDLLKNERLRIDVLLKNNGYFYFNPDYLLFKADSSGARNSVSLSLTLKDSIPKNALIVFRINRVNIDQDYSLNDITLKSLADTSRFQSKISSGKGMNIKPEVLVSSIYLKKNDIYSRKNHNITLNRLMSLGNFKFVSVKFSKSDTTAGDYLDATILMTPMSKYTFSTEADIVSKSNNYTGPRLNLSYLNKNTFRGAEMLKLNMAGSFEAQLRGTGNNLYSYSLNPQLELYFPRFLVPFHIENNSIYLPKTRFTLSYTYLKRVNYFDMGMLQFIYGFNWKKDIRTEHELNPVNISYTSIGNKSEVFNTLLNSNPFLKKSYEEQFIAGASYSFTYNEQIMPNKKIQYYLNYTSEIAGNTFSLFKVITGEKISSGSPSKIAGSIYSQYSRISIDGRAYYNFPDKNKIAIRLYAGAAIPYGNSSTLPYIKQFFSGGTNSIRAFRINSVGPGTSKPSAESNSFLQTGGDIKLEMNAEYRFSIYHFIKGALFTDAGNIWLLKSNPENTGSPFSFSQFYHELSVGAGMGLRFDISFVILRFDLATPLRKPWITENNGWVINQIDLGSSIWRRENLLLNIAIGYPF